MGHDSVDGPLLDRLPHAKVVSLMSVGFDAIDVEAAKARGVAVTNTPDVLTNDVADLALALLIAVSRKIIAGDRFVRAGHWAAKRNMRLATAVHGKTMAVLGLGRIGTAIARRGEAFGLKVIYGGRTKKADAPWPYYADLVELARAADFLVVAIPGGGATRHMVDAKVIEALGPRGYLVNIARGSVVDEKAMVEALVARTVGRCGPRCVRGRAARAGSFIRARHGGAATPCGERHRRNPVGHGPVDARQSGGLFRGQPSADSRHIAVRPIIVQFEPCSARRGPCGRLAVAIFLHYVLLGRRYGGSRNGDF